MTYKLFTMKILLAFALVLITSSATYAQEIDNRLLERYSIEELTELSKTDNDKLVMLNYALDNAIVYAEYSKEKNLELSSIDMPAENATFISLGYEITNQNQFYRINGSDKMLVVKSAFLLKNEFKNNKK